MFEFASQHPIATTIIALATLFVIYDVNVLWTNVLKAKYLSEMNKK